MPRLSPCRSVAASLVVSLAVPFAPAAPVAVDDVYSLSEDSVLAAVPERGVLAEDFERFLTPVTGSSWFFLDQIENELGRSDPYPTDSAGRTWHDPEFDLATSSVAPWSVGDAPLQSGGIRGFGNLPDTLAGVGSGPFGGFNLVTTYLFRSSFEATPEQSANPDGWIARLLFDDAGIIYLNGSRAFDVRMPDPDPTPQTFGGRNANEGQFETVFPTLESLAGTNSLAVEVHQQSLDSSDVGFDIDLFHTGPFTYVDDAFGTSAPDLASGDLDPAGADREASLSVTVGGTNGAPQASSGAWQVEFDLQGATTVRVQFLYSLEIQGGFDAGEYVDGVVAVDGVRVGDGPDGSFTRLEGDGGATSDSGSRDIEIPLSAGRHVLAVGAFNNRSNANNETGTIYFDGLQLDALSAADGVLANDTGAPVLTELVSPPANGDVDLMADGNFFYTPAPDFHGTDTFTYRAIDALGASSQAQVTLTVSAVPDAPAALPDEFAATEDTTLIRPGITGVLANDSDPDGDALTAQLISYEGDGTLILRPDGGITYIPAPDFAGTESFTYVASDGLLTSPPTTAVITVAAVDDPPVASPDAYATDPGQPLDVNDPAAGVLANDSDIEGQTLTAATVSPPANGALVLVPDGTFSYRPDPGFAGTDTFTYRASDGTSVSTPATVTVAVDATPTALPETYTTIEDSPLIRFGEDGILANDSDPEGKTLSILRGLGPLHGVLELTPGGGFNYTPDPDFTGVDTFTYRVHDGVRTSQPATVTFEVTAVDDPPVARADSFRVTPGFAFSASAAGGVLANDSDPDGDALVAAEASPPASGSLELAPDGSFTYTPAPGFTGTDGFSYTAGDGSLTSPPTTVTLLVEPDPELVVINEIMYHPPSEDDRDEFLELHNRGRAPVDVGGWQFDDGVGFTFPPGTTLPPGGFLTVAADPGRFATTYPESPAPLGPWSGRLSNRGEQVTLRDAGGARVDRVSYSDQGDWARRARFRSAGADGWVWESPHDGGGASLELVNPAVTNGNGQNWLPSDGAPTPGAPNSVASADTAPLVSDLTHSPAVPSPGTRANIAAQISDSGNAPLTATLRYRVSSLAASPYTSIPMRDDGISGDGDAGDGLFGAALPPFPDQTVVEYYVVASDGELSRSYPVPSLADSGDTPSTPYLLQVSDAGANPPPGPGGDPVYRFVFSVPDEAEFIETGNGNTWPNDSDAQVNAALVAQTGDDTVVRQLCGVRRRGNGSRNILPNSWRVSLPRDRPWDGTTRFNINAQYTYLQLLGNRLAQAAGLPAADVVPVRVLINGTDHTGIANPNRRYGRYVRVEAISDDFVSQKFDGDSSGNLYRARRPDNEWAYRNGDVEAYLGDGWSKGTNETENDWSDLDALLGVVNLSPRESYFDDLSAVADLGQWTRWFAFMTFVNTAETNLSNGTDDDYYVYRGVDDPRFVLIPHDFDTILGKGGTDTSPESTLFPSLDTGFAGQSIPQLARFFGDPEITRMHYSAFADLAATVFEPDSFEAFTRNALGGWVPEAEIADLVAYAAARRAHILASIPSRLTVSSGLDTRDGLPYTTGGEPVVLGGTIDSINTRSVTVNGVEVPFDPFAGTWTTDLPPLQLLARNAVWRYYDLPDPPPAGWQAPGFDDSSWDSGRARLGYGDDGELTTTSFGDDPDAKLATTYFRTTFSVEDPSALTSVSATVEYDDGFIAFLNGSEVWRQSLPEVVDHDTYTGAHDESTVTFDLPVESLLGGTNNLAIELHQSLPDSVDLGLAARIVAEPDRDGQFGLDPGVNRVSVVARDAAGQPIARELIEVWYDVGLPATVSGTLASDTIWEANAGPFSVVGDLVVPAGVTLTIAPGTVVYFEDGTTLTVRGRLVADGTEDARIQLRQAPDRSGGWGGVEFDSTTEDNILRHLDMASSRAGDQSVLVDGSRLTLDDVTWSATTRKIIEATGPMLEITNCAFPPTDGEEVIHGNGLGGAGFFIIRGCVFEPSTGYNDIIDFSGGRRPGPIFQAYDNVFLGATDDAIDLDDADGHIEGNTFFNVHTDDPERPSTANAIATDAGANLTIVRNVFYDVDHALLLKGGSSAVFENNTVVDATIAAVNFDEPDRDGATPGAGITIDGCIFDGPAPVFENQFSAGGEPDPAITVDRSLLPASFHALGTGNSDEPPGFAAAPVDFALEPGCAAEETGPNESDMGAAVPAGATISGEPPSQTSRTAATLAVAGPGITHYRFALDGGAFSEPAPVGTSLELSSLGAGLHSVHVIGMNSAGLWQEDATVSKLWTVAPLLSRVLINEALASNGGVFEHEGTFPDFIELYNDSGSPADLSGWSLSDSPDDPRRFVFPAGTTVPARGLLTVYADSEATSGLHTGFGLAAEGERVLLYRPAGDLADSVEFGPQATGFSVSRSGHELEFGVTTPTPGATNARSLPGPVSGLRINEWLASNEIVFENDFVELFNRSRRPVALGGLYLTDNPVAAPDKHPLPALSFVAPAGFSVFTADGDTSQGADHLGFNISKEYEPVALTAPGGTVLDYVFAAAQPPDISTGRSPDGGSAITDFPLPSPGYSNSSPPGDDVAQVTSLRITELMFNPPDGAEFEFVELQNTGSEPLPLTGVRFTEGIGFTFPDIVLGPGAYTVIVRSADHFRALYGDGVPVAGAFTGRLDNGGERLRLETTFTRAGILDFEYDDAWVPAADGGGFSIVVPDTSRARSAWGKPDTWEAGGVVRGTPGQPETITLAVAASPETSVGTPLPLSAVTTPAGATVRWSVTAGPAPVTIDDPDAASTTATFSAAGRYTLVAEATADSVTRSSTHTVTVFDRYADWATRAFPPGTPEGLTRPDADPDADGLANFVEYALALLPMTKDAVSAYSRDPSPDGSASVFFNLRLADPSEVSVTAEASSDLTGWDSSDVFVQEIATTGEILTVRATDTRPPGLARHRAIRLRVTLLTAP